MPDVQTLEELKAENAKAEQEAAEETASNADESQAAAVEETKELDEANAETANDNSEDDAIEAWMQEEEESSDDEKKFSDHDVAALRRKMKAKASEKIEEKDSEIEQLRAELETLKGSVNGSPVNSGKPKAKPKLSDYDYDEEKYEAAMSEWLDNQIDQKLNHANNRQSETAQQAQAKVELEKAVNSHYERAVNLAKESGIEAETYQSADLQVRQTFERLAPGQGDSVTDGIIAALGEGSEKVMFYLGRNPAALNEVATIQDPYRLMAHLGELKAKVSQPKKRVSNAKKPVKTADGEHGKLSVSQYEKRYKKAKSATERFNIVQEAKKAGISKAETRRW